MIKEKIIFSILANLGLLEGHFDATSIKKAAQSALNDKNFVIETYKGVALRSILGTLNNNTIPKYLKAQKTSLEKDFFELSDVPMDTSLQVKNLKEALAKSTKDDNALLWVLECQATTLAVSQEHDTIALFDFVKLTAAFAYCFVESDKVRMVSANISGIQSYLYEIVSKNAAKLLKGRSFYLQLLGDSILNEFLEKFKVKSYNVIYASGGGFYILVPDYDGVETVFNAITSEISEKIYAVHKTSLFVETALSAPFDGCENLKNTWDNLFTALKKRRNNRLSWNEALHNNFFGFVEDGGDTDRDPITNEEITKGEKTGKLFDGTEVLPITKEQIDLGKYLREANYWYSTKDRVSGHRIMTDPLGYHHYFEKNKIEGSKNINGKAFNNFDTDLNTLLYGGNQYPVFETQKEIDKVNKSLKINEPPYEIGDVKPFDFLAQGENLDRLAILRMDVDGLGTVFSDGFDNLCKYATVSRSLDMFFKGHLNTLWKNYEHTTQIIYSGGDDLFVVGKWNDVFAFSRDIHEAFKKWSCGVLTLSGGLVLLPAKFPVMQGAKMAEQAEKKAKSHEFNGQKKNAICFLDMPLNWDEELPMVKELYLKVVDLLIYKKVLSMNFLSKIAIYAEARHTYWENVVKFNEGKIDRKPNPAWIWTMLYDLSRYKEQQVKTTEGKEFIGEIIKSIMSNAYRSQRFNEKRHFLDILSLATRWAELEKRT